MTSIRLSEASVVEQVREALAPDRLWQAQPAIDAASAGELAALPLPGNVSKEERRYPTTLAGVATFLDDLFVRHLVQVQNSLLQEGSLGRIIRSMNRGQVTIVDIGSGPAVASLAVLDLLDTLRAAFQSPPIRVEIALNDVSAVCLEAGRRLIHAYCSRRAESFRSVTVDTLGKGFPDNLPEIRKVALVSGGLDVLLMSYIMVPLKQEMSHREIERTIDILLNFGSMTAVGLILQDKFNESLIRRVGRNLARSTRKASLRLAVDEVKLGMKEQTYTYFETLII